MAVTAIGGSRRCCAMPAGRSTTSGLSVLWRREGLQVPGKQPKRGRPWLNDGSCVRLRAGRADHVWSYDFVHHRTHDGRAFRTLNVLDEFTRESLAIRVRRKLSSTDVIDVLTDLFILRGIPAYVRSDNGPEFVAEAVRRWITAVGARDRFHRAWFTLGEWIHRELQRAAARRTPEWGDLLHPQRGPGSHRSLAAPLQCRTPTWQPGIPAAGTGNDHLAKLAARLRSAPPATQLGGETADALTFKLDQSVGAGQADSHQIRPMGILCSDRNTSARNGAECSAGPPGD